MEVCIIMFKFLAGTVRIELTWPDLQPGALTNFATSPTITI